MLEAVRITLHFAPLNAARSPQRAAPNRVVVSTKKIKPKPNEPSTAEPAS
jgi:hypothetical protein